MLVSACNAGRPPVNRYCIWLMALAVTGVATSAAEMGPAQPAPTVTAGQLAVETLTVTSRVIGEVCSVINPSLKQDFEQAVIEMRGKGEEAIRRLRESEKFAERTQVPIPEAMIDRLSETMRQLRFKFIASESAMDCPELLADIRSSTADSLQPGIEAVLMRWLTPMSAATTWPDPVKAAACGIEMAIAPSRDNYLIAVVEHARNVSCADKGCYETVRVDRVLAHVSRSREVAPAELALGLPKGFDPVKPGDMATLAPVGFRRMGVYLQPPGGSSYYPTSARGPVTASVLEIYEKAVPIATQAPPGAPDCSGLVPAQPSARRNMETAHFYAAVSSVPDEQLIEAMKHAVRPFGQEQASSGTGYPQEMLKGIFAFFRSERPAATLLTAAKTAGCVSIAVTDYAMQPTGYAASVAAAIRDALNGAFGGRVQFHSDDNCTTPLVSTATTELAAEFVGYWTNVDAKYENWWVMERNSVVNYGTALGPGRCTSDRATIKGPRTIEVAFGNAATVDLSIANGLLLFNAPGGVAVHKRLSRTDICRKPDGSYFEGAPFTAD